MELNLTITIKNNTIQFSDELLNTIKFNNKDEFPLTIEFHKNNYEICSISNDSLNNLFSNEIIEIEFQNSKYNLKKYQLVMIILFEFIKMIEKNYILNQ